MKHKRFSAILLALALALSLGTTAFAASSTTATVPVTLTVDNEYRAVNVTVPAALHELLVRAAAGAVVQERIVDTGGILRVRFEKIDLTLELGGVCPVIVPLAEGDVFAARVREEHGIVDVYILRIQVLFLIERAHDIRVLLGVFADYRGGTVGRSVVIHEQLERKIGLLADYALERVADIFFVVIGRTEYGNETIFTHDMTSDKLFLRGAAGETAEHIQHEAEAVNAEDNGAADIYRNAERDLNKQSEPIAQTEQAYRVDAHAHQAGEQQRREHIAELTGELVPKQPAVRPRVYDEGDEP